MDPLVGADVLNGSPLSRTPASSSNLGLEFDCRAHEIIYDESRNVILGMDVTSELSEEILNQLSLASVGIQDCSLCDSNSPPPCLIANSQVGL